MALEGVRAVVPVLASELPGNIADLARFLPSNAGNALPCGYTEATSARAQSQPAHGRRACPRARRPFGFALACRGPALFLNDRSSIVMAMGRPREFEPDEVLDSVMRQFWEHGYRATSVDDLVRATGVKPGSLYAAFPGGKRALLMGSLKRYSKLVVPLKLGELAEQGASVAQVRAYFDGLVRDLLSSEGRQGCLLVNSAIENAAVDPEVAAVVRGHHARLEHCFAAALRTAVQRGEIPGSVDPAARAKALVATSQGLMVIGKANPDEGVLRAIVDSAFADLG